MRKTDKIVIISCAVFTVLLYGYIFVSVTNMRYEEIEGYREYCQDNGHTDVDLNMGEPIKTQVLYGEEVGRTIDCTEPWGRIPYDP